MLKKMKQIITILIVVCLSGCILQNNALLLDRLANTNSVVVLQIDSRKQSKMEIFHCTVEKTVHGTKPPDKITLSFLHFPDCQRLGVGSRYLCAIKHESSSDYTLIRSDMLAQGSKTDLYTYAWKADSPEAKELEKKIRMHNKAIDGD